MRQVMPGDLFVRDYASYMLTFMPLVIRCVYDLGWLIAPIV